MADNLTAGNPRAHAVRVYYFGTSTIYEGMPVCYDNSTTNWFGGSVADTGEITASTTTAEGSQNEGKYIRVENPNADNNSMFAGVVKRGGWVGTIGPSALDIYIPNGAVVPVRTDQNCLIDQTVLAINTGEQELGVPLRADSRPVAIARETIDRGTAGLVLAELNPHRFIYQDNGGTALSIDDSDTTADVVVNRIRVKSLQTGGQFTALSIKAESAAGAGTVNQRGLALRAVGILSATPAGQVHGTNLDLEITGGTITEPVSACLIKLYESGATVSSSNIFSVLTLQNQVTEAPAANSHCWMYLEENGSQDVDHFIITKNKGELGDIACGVSGTISFDSSDRMIQVRFTGSSQTYYIPLVKDNA